MPDWARGPGWDAIRASDKFFSACGDDDVKAVTEMLKIERDVFDMPNPCGETPLMRATKGGCIDVVELLLSHGAKVSSRDTDGRTALMLALHSGSDLRSFFVLKLLCKAPDFAAVINTKHMGGQTPLQSALNLKFYRCAELLRAHDAKM